MYCDNHYDCSRLSIQMLLVFAVLPTGSGKSLRFVAEPQFNRWKTKSEWEWKSVRRNLCSETISGGTCWVYQESRWVYCNEFYRGAYVPKRITMSVVYRSQQHSIRSALLVSNDCWCQTRCSAQTVRLLSTAGFSLTGLRIDVIQRL